MLELLVVVDRNFRIQSASESFYCFFDETQKSTQGKTIDSVSVDEDWDFQQLEATYEDIRRQPDYTEGLGAELGTIHLQGKQLQVVARQLLLEDMRPDLLLLIIREEAKEDDSGIVMLDDQGAFDMQVVLDKDLKVVSANQRYYQFFHTSDGVTEGRQLQNLGGHQWDIPQLSELLQQVATEKQPFRGFEVNYDFPKIGPKSLRLKAQTLVRYDGEPDLILLTIEDLTETREIEEAIRKLRSSKERFEVIFNSTYQFTGLLDRNGRLLEANQTALDFAGISLNDIAEKYFWQTPWFREEDLLQLRRSVKRAAAGELVQYEVEVVGQNQQAITIDFSLKPDFTDAGQVRWIVAEGRDITEKKQIEQELLRSKEEAIRNQEMLDSVVNHVGLGVKYLKALYDSEGKLVDFVFVQLNQQAKELLFSQETPQEDIIGKRLLYLLPEIGQVDFENYQEVLKTGVTLETETQYQHTHGEQWFRRVVVKLGDGVVITIENITQRKQAKISLQKSKQLIDSIYESASVGIDALKIKRDDKGNIVDFIYQRTNQKSQEINNRADTNIIGKGLLALHPGVKQQGLFDKYVRVVETGETFHDIFFYGHEHLQVWVDLTVSKWDDGILFTYSDITERKRAEERVRKSADLVEAVFNASDAVLQHYEAVRNEQGEIEDFVYLKTNQKALEMAGMPPDTDLIGQRLLSVHPGVKVTGVFDILVRVTDSGIPEEKLFHYNQEGIDKWFQGNYRQLHDGVVVTITDITNLKLAEQRLLNAERKFRILVENTPDVISRLDTELRHTFMNSAIKTQTGMEPEHFLGLKPQDIGLDKAETQRFVQLCIEARDLKETRTYYGTVPTPAGDNSIYSLIAPELNENEEVVSLLVITRDITELAKVEQQLRKRTEELEAMNRELSSFTYSISHDLRAPLRAMHGFTSMLTDRYQSQLDEEGKRLLSIITTNANRMGKLINDLLGFSHLGKKTMVTQPLNLLPIIEESFSELNQAHGNRATLDIQPLPTVQGDRNMVRQLISNLLSNALKFSSREKQPQVKVGLESDGAMPVIFVGDNGVGFNQKYDSKLFEVFQRLHRDDDFEGTGVGLAIVQKIVHRHGGEVWAKGKEGEGATVYFSLPKA